MRVDWYCPSVGTPTALCCCWWVGCVSHPWASVGLHRNIPNIDCSCHRPYRNEIFTLPVTNWLLNWAACYEHVYVTSVRLSIAGNIIHPEIQRTAAHPCLRTVHKILTFYPPVYLSAAYFNQLWMIVIIFYFFSITPLIYIVVWVTEDIRIVKRLSVGICWWRWFDWHFARPVVTTSHRHHLLLQHNPGWFDRLI